MHRVSGCPILQFLELFWIFFVAGNEFEKIPFFRLVLAGLFISFDFGNGIKMSDENFVIPEFKYLQNKE